MEGSTLQCDPATFNNCLRVCIRFRIARSLWRAHARNATFRRFDAAMQPGLLRSLSPCLHLLPNRSTPLAGHMGGTLPLERFALAGACAERYLQKVRRSNATRPPSIIVSMSASSPESLDPFGGAHGRNAAFRKVQRCSATRPPSIIVFVCAFASESLDRFGGRMRGTLPSEGSTQQCNPASFDHCLHVCIFSRIARPLWRGTWAERYLLKGSPWRAHARNATFRRFDAAMQPGLLRSLSPCLHLLPNRSTPLAGHMGGTLPFGRSNAAVQPGRLQ